MFTMKNKEDVHYSLIEIFSAILVHSVIFFWKCVAFCWIFNKFVIGDIK